MAPYDNYRRIFSADLPTFQAAVSQNTYPCHGNAIVLLTVPAGPEDTNQVPFMFRLDAPLAFKPGKWGSLTLRVQGTPWEVALRGLQAQVEELHRTRFRDYTVKPALADVVNKAGETLERQAWIIKEASEEDLRHNLDPALCRGSVVRINVACKGIWVDTRRRTLSLRWFYTRVITVSHPVSPFGTYMIQD